MVVLVSFLLVLAAAVTLVVGLLQSGLTLIYISIGCSVVAGLVLAVAVLRGRPEPKAAPAPAPAAAEPYRASPPPPAPVFSAPGPEEDEPWKVQTPPRFARSAPAFEPEPEPEEPAEPLVAGYARRAFDEPTGRVDIPSGMVPTSSRAAFPIPDYEDMRAPELLGRIDDLDAAELEALRSRELSGKNRMSVISRIDTRLEELGDPRWEVDEQAWEGGGDGGYVEGEFPIPDYDDLRVGQILPLLRDLSDDELEQVRQYEEASKARSGVLNRIEAMGAGAAPAPRATPAFTRQVPAVAPPDDEPSSEVAGTTSLAAAVAAAKAKQAKKD